MRWALALAGLYNLIWGLLVVSFPYEPFRMLGMDPPRYPEIWQCVGMVVGVYGVGYLAAATDPLHHWPIVLTGLLGKTLGPAGFAMAASQGRLPWEFGWIIVANDLIWWIPFGLILARSYSHHLVRERVASPEIQRMALEARTQYGDSVLSLSHREPVLLVFLRHFGCTFCREALADLAERRGAIESAGTRIVLVHMGREPQAASFFDRYALGDLPRVSDPVRHLYRAFGLGRGGLLKLFGPKVFWRGFQAGVIGRHGVGRLAGDGFQMPGVFLIFHGEVIRSYRHHTAADRPDYMQLSGAQQFPV